MKIIALVGSLRKESLNLKLAEIVKRNMKDVDFEIITLENMPFFNEDIEFPAPKAVEELREKIKKADAVWFFTPEYNHSYSGVLKNTLDWLSRAIDDDEDSVLDEKKAILSGISYAMAGTLNAQDDLVQLLSLLNMKIMNYPRLAVPSAKLPDDDNKFLIRIIEAAKKFIQE